MIYILEYEIHRPPNNEKVAGYILVAFEGESVRCVNDRMWAIQGIVAKSLSSAKNRATRFLKKRGLTSDYDTWRDVEMASSIAGHIKPFSPTNGDPKYRTFKSYRIFEDWKTGESFCATLRRIE